MPEFKSEAPDSPMTDPILVPEFGRVSDLEYPHTGAIGITLVPEMKGKLRSGHEQDVNPGDLPGISPTSP